MALLEIKSLFAGYGDSTVVQDVSLSIDSGEVVCLLGANGAGKTTTMSTLAGTLRPEGGAIFYDGQDLRRVKLHDRVAAGLVLCPEGRKVFPSLSVEENLYLGSFHRAARQTRKQKFAEIYELFPVLAERRLQLAGSMSGGEQQMLALGRALMANPRVLLLDEPSLGLAPRLVLQLFALIRRISQLKITILLVEQNSKAALGVASRGYVMTAGRIVLEGAAAVLRDPDRLHSAFFGDLSAARGER